MIVVALALLIAGLRDSGERTGSGLAGHSNDAEAIRLDPSSAETAPAPPNRPGEPVRPGENTPVQPEAGRQGVEKPAPEAAGEADNAGPGASNPENQDREMADPAPQRSLSGSVIDDAGAPLPGIEVRASPAVAVEAPTDSQTARAVSDALGMFEFDELGSGEYVLSVPESETHQGETLRARAGSSAADIHLQRKGEILVIGSVLDASGAPLANTSVRSLGSDRRITADEEGRYRITIDRQKVSAQPVLDFSLRGYRTLRERVPDRPRAGEDTVELDVTMEPLGDLVTFIGSVQGKNGVPVSGAGITLSSLSDSFNASVSTGEFGEFNIEAVEAGNRYRLVVDPRNSDYRRFTSEPLIIDQANNAFDVQLEDGGQASLAGTLVDPTGKPLPYFMLWIRNSEQTGTAPIPVQTDAGGRFDPVLLGAGPIELESRSNPRLEASGISLSSGESLDVRVPLDWGDDWLLGRVIDDNGKPVAQARVTVHWSREFGDGRSMSSRQTRSDAAGFFGFSNLGAPRYRLTCSAPGFKTRQVDAALEAGSELEIRLERLNTGGS